MGDVGRAHWVFAAVDNHQAEHQGTVVETSGALNGTSISILFDFRASNSFISPSVVEHGRLVVARQGIKWQFELASRENVAVESLVQGCNLQIGSLTTTVDLRILPLGSYDVVLGMDWLNAHCAIIDCRHKVVRCVDDVGNQVEIVGIQRPISLCLISAMQLKRCFRQGF